MASIERIQDSFQMVNDSMIDELRRQVDAIKRSMDSIRNDFEKEAKQLAKDHKNQDLVGHFGGVRKVKVVEMDAELVRLRGSENQSFGDISRRLNTIASRLE